MTERLHFHFSLSFIGEGNGNPLQCSCLENLRGGGAWWAAIYGVAQSRTRLKRLSSSSSRIWNAILEDCETFFNLAGGIYPEQTHLIQDGSSLSLIRIRKSISCLFWSTTPSKLCWLFRAILRNFILRNLIWGMFIRMMFIRMALIYSSE